MHDPIETLRAELTRQDEALAAFEQTLRDLGDVALAVPQTFLEELEELARPRAHNPNMQVPFLGIRG